MLKTMRKTLASLMIVAAFVAAPMALPTAAFAQAQAGGGTSSGGSGSSIDITKKLGCGANLDTTESSCDTSDGKDRLQSLLTLVINLASVAIGVFAVIMLLIAGGKYINGKEASVKEARSQVTYGVIGLVIVALAQFIVKFVLNKVSSTGNGT